MKMIGSKTYDSKTEIETGYEQAQKSCDSFKKEKNSNYYVNKAGKTVTMTAVGPTDNIKYTGSKYKEILSKQGYVCK